MTKLKLLFPLAAGLISLAAWPAYAHGFGERTELAIPLGFFMIGAAIVVAASFVILSLFLRSSATHSYWRFDVLRVGVLGAVLKSEPFLFPIKLVSVFLLGLVVATGLVGDQSPTLNFAPTFVWIIWWVGMAYVSALVGNLWNLVNPWKITFEWVERLVGSPSRGAGIFRYPERWDSWPALVLFFVFSWLENVYSGAAQPFKLGLLILLYSVVTWGGMLAFGKHQWLRHGEAFSVLFGFFARFSPTEVAVTDVHLCRTCDQEECDSSGEGCVNCYECFQRAGAEQREFNLRPFAVGLAVLEGEGEFTAS